MTGLLGHQFCLTGAQIAWLYKRGCCINAADLADCLISTQVPIDGVLNDWDGPGVVIRQRLRSEKGHSRPRLLGNFRDLWIIGGYHYFLKAAAL